MTLVRNNNILKESQIIRKINHRSLVMKNLFIPFLIVVFIYSNLSFAGDLENNSNSNVQTSKQSDMFSHFPEGNYTPNGYLTNPYHTAALNRSGVLRSVPPLGFGFWARPLPWPYGGAEFGFGLSRHRNYLSLLHLAINIDDKMFYRFEDFDNNNVDLYSQYHTQNMMSYDFEYNGLIFKAMYFQVDEHSLVKDTGAVMALSPIMISNMMSL